MSNPTWHADPALLTAFCDGRLDGVVSASLERHLEHCARCRGALPSRLDRHTLERVWERVRDEVQSPRQPSAIRLARRLGLPESTSVLLAATASLRTAWLVGALVALSFAAVSVMLGGGEALAPFLLVAPLVPVIGVAAAYDEHEDPLESLSSTTPYGRTRLILVRTVAVLVSVLPAAVLLGLALPGPPWVAGAWLGPALTMIPVMLAISSYGGPRMGASTVAIGWTGVVMLSVRHLPPTWPVEATQQVVYLLLAVGSGMLLVLRSRRTHQIGAVL